MTRAQKILFLLVALIALALPANASANPTDRRIIGDCADDGRVDGHYGPGALNHASHHIPTDVDEYTDCRSAIDAALARGRSGGNGPPASTNPALKTASGAFAGSQSDLAAYKAQARRAAKGGSPSVNLAGQNVAPVTGGLARFTTAANDLPLPLTIALAAVAALCAAGMLAVAWRRWPQIKRAPLRLRRR
jgi:hypothetical protein